MREKCAGLAVDCVLAIDRPSGAESKEGDGFVNTEVPMGTEVYPILWTEKRCS